MKLYYYLTLTILLCSTSLLRAQWEPTGFTQNLWTLCQAENGNLIAAEDVYPDLGNLFVSQDDGVTWTEASTTPYSYGSNLVVGESVYMGGNGGNVAISHDNGITWEISNFLDLFPGADPNMPIIGIEFHNGRVYASLLTYGIVYSEDQGQTWHLTDVDSLMVPNPDNNGKWTYNLRSFNGKLYNIGAFGIWEYDETADLWTQVDGTWYGFNSEVVDDTLYIVYNAQGIPDGIRYTTDFQSWNTMPLPAGVDTSSSFLKYYNGAFFLGSVMNPIFYTLDNGTTWTEYSEGLPNYEPVPELTIYANPMNLVFDGDTMYVGLYSDDINALPAGVYKAPVPEDVIMGVDEIAESYQVAVYPNPATNYVTFEFSKDGIINANLQVTDAMGRVVLHKSITDNHSLTIKTDAWSSGIYFYSIVGKNLKTSGKLIVK